MSEDRVGASLLTKARSSQDDLEGRLLLAAAVQRVALGIGIETVVVGGTAADFYAAGAAGSSAAYPKNWLPSGDLDLVALAVDGGTNTLQRLAEALAAQLGFEPLFRSKDSEGRPLWSRGLNVPNFRYGLEIVNDELRGDPKAERVVTLEVENESVRLRGPEDTLISYAESGWVFRDGRDWERALATWRTMSEEIDVDYLRRRARERRMPGVLAEVLAQRPLPEKPEPLR